MKLDRKEILKALETITIAGEGKNMVEGAIANVITFGDEVVDLVFIHRLCTSRNVQRRYQKTILELVSLMLKSKLIVK
jgi:ATP-binding protein involved in chromosome partitioning